MRNLPTISGNITWSRHLIHRAMVPLKHFPKDKLMPNGKAIKQYTTASKISITLYAYELAWRQKWAMSVEKAREGLICTLLVQNDRRSDDRSSEEAGNQLLVNFCPDLP